MDLIIKKNEAEINENVAKGLLGIFGIVFLVVVLCWVGVFHIFLDMTKYLIVTATAIMAGTAYVLFTFQAVIIFVLPTILAGFYMNKRLLYYSGVISVGAIIVAHMITGVYLRQPWIEPFTGMEAIIRYGAIPRCLQYLGCFLLIFLMVNRYMEIILHIVPTKERLTNDTDEKIAEENEFEMLLQELTEREKSVFVLMVSGYTNMQIADKLCLSNGTVKNYISAIYEKIGTKERNTLIMKYSAFVKEND